METLRDDPDISLSQGIRLTSLKRRLLSGGIWAFSGKVFTAFGGVLVAALLARLLSPADLGAYFLALSIVTFGALVARGGLDQTILQLVAQGLGREREPEVRAVVRRIYGIAAIFAASVAGLLWLGAARWLAENLFSSPALATIAALLAPWVAVLAFEVLVSETFRGFHDIPKATIFGGLVTRGLIVASLAVLLAAGASLELSQAVLIIIAAAASSLLSAALMLRGKLRRLRRGQPRLIASAEILRATWPLLISNVTLFVVGQAGIWIAGAFRPEGEVAVYGAAANLVRLVGMSMVVVNLVVPPIIGELYVRGETARLERVIRVAASVAAVPSLIVLAAFVTLGAPIMGLVYGSYYREGALVLALLSVGQIVHVLVGSCGYVLIMTGHQRDLMFSALTSSVVSVLGGIALVEPLRLTGIALAVAAGISVMQLQMLWFAKRRLGVWTHISYRLALDEARKALHSGKNRS